MRILVLFCLATLVTMSASASTDITFDQNALKLATVVSDIARLYPAKWNSFLSGSYWLCDSSVHSEQPAPFTNVNVYSLSACGAGGADKTEVFKRAKVTETQLPTRAGKNTTYKIEILP